MVLTAHCTCNHTRDYSIGTVESHVNSDDTQHVRLLCSNTVIRQVIAAYNVQLGQKLWNKCIRQWSQWVLKFSKDYKPLCTRAQTITRPCPCATCNPNPNQYLRYQCPWTVLGTSKTLPNFLGNDYYCDSGNPSRNSWRDGHLYPDCLWDNSGPSCVSGSTCCNNPDQPWFKKKLTQPANEDMEMHWCGNESPVSNEATATTRVELYISVD